MTVSVPTIEIASRSHFYIDMATSGAVDPPNLKRWCAAVVGDYAGTSRLKDPLIGCVQMPRSEARAPESRSEESPFLLACRRQKVPYTPVWYMRMAGRSLPEYRALRTDRKMLDALTNPDLITEISLQPIRRYDVDAAIFFSDIVVPLRAIGIGIDFRQGVGP